MMELHQLYASIRHQKKVEAIKDALKYFEMME